MKTKWRAIVRAGTLIAVMACLSYTAMGNAAGEAPRINKEEVKALLGDPDVVILDARTGSSWSHSDKKIKGALRIDPGEVASWSGKFSKTKKIIVYCS